MSADIQGKIQFRFVLWHEFVPGSDFRTRVRVVPLCPGLVWAIRYGPYREAVRVQKIYFVITNIL